MRGVSFRDNINVTYLEQQKIHSRKLEYQHLWGLAGSHKRSHHFP